MARVSPTASPRSLATLSAMTTPPSWSAVSVPSVIVTLATLGRVFGSTAVRALVVPWSSQCPYRVVDVSATCGKVRDPLPHLGTAHRASPRDGSAPSGRPAVMASPPAAAMALTGEEPITATKVMRARAKVRAMAVDAVRRGLRTVASRASCPGTPRRFSGRPTDLASLGARTGPSTTTAPRSRAARGTDPRHAASRCGGHHESDCDGEQDQTGDQATALLVVAGAGSEARIADRATRAARRAGPTAASTVRRVPAMRPTSRGVAGDGQGAAGEGEAGRLGQAAKAVCGADADSGAARRAGQTDQQSFAEHRGST